MNQSRPPPSPCINVCVLEPSGYCRGCLRSLEEIAGWIAMSPAEQWQVLEALERRKAQITSRS